MLTCAALWGHDNGLTAMSKALGREFDPGCITDTVAMSEVLSIVGFYDGNDARFYVTPHNILAVRTGAQTIDATAADSTGQSVAVRVICHTTDPQISHSADGDGALEVTFTRTVQVSPDPGAVLTALSAEYRFKIDKQGIITLLSARPLPDDSARLCPWLTLQFYDTTVQTDNTGNWRRTLARITAQPPPADRQDTQR